MVAGLDLIKHRWGLWWKNIPLETRSSVGLGESGFDFRQRLHPWIRTVDVPSIQCRECMMLVAHWLLDVIDCTVQKPGPIVHEDAAASLAAGVLAYTGNRTTCVLLMVSSTSLPTQSDCW